VARYLVQTEAPVLEDRTFYDPEGMVEFRNAFGVCQLSADQSEA